MSSSSNNAADVLVGNGGEKRTHQEMTHSSVSDDDDYTLFEKAKERLNAAQEELDLAQQNMERRRQKIRNSGNYEPDSLLCLSDGEGHLLAHILKNYLDTNDLGRCAAVCHTLKNQADGCWDTFETRILTHPSLYSPSAQSCKERVVRYLRASDFASRIGAMGDNISKHVIINRYRRFDDTMITERVGGYCTGCDFPDLTYYNRNEYDLFVRLSKTSNNELLTEGFTSIDWDDVLLEGLDFSKWPELLEINRLVITQGDEFGLEEGGHEYRLLHNVMRDLTVVIVAVNKLSSEPSLVAANNNFGREGGSADHGIDMMGDHAFCWARGELSTHSHGPVDENENRIKLGVTYDTSTWTDTNTGEVLRKECQWKLSI